jgi:hypothetical protein
VAETQMPATVPDEKQSVEGAIRVRFRFILANFTLPYCNEQLFAKSIWLRFDLVPARNLTALADLDYDS